MPTFHKEGQTILYVHVPKTGGTSIELFFENQGFQTEYLDRSSGPQSLNEVRKCSPQHMHGTTLAKIFDLSKFSYIFMTIRNPFTRIQSEYRMLRHGNLAGPEINAWIESVLIKYETNPFVLDNHIRPQAEFLVPGCQVFRQENLGELAWASDIAKKLPLEFEAGELTRHMDFSNEPSLANETIDDARRGLLRQFYEKDFALFGYDDWA